MIIYAYDTQANGTELGPGSIARLDKGIDYILESEWNDWDVILGAGFDPSRPDVLTSLKTMMEYYIIKKLKQKGFYLQDATVPGMGSWSDGKKRTIKIITSRSDAWGSFDETKSALQTWKNFHGRVGYYYAVSADFHLPRIRLIWSMLHLPVKTIGVPWKPSVFELALEPIKMIKVILKGFHGWVMGEC